MARHSNFIVRGGANFNPLYQEFNKAQKRMNAFKKSISAALKPIGIALSGLAIGKLIKDGTRVAMSVESAMDNIARNMEESSQAFNHWVETQSKALGMGRADAYKYGSTFSNLLDSFTSNAKETAEQTQELMKAAAIIASKTGRTYDDVANRIRSGMLGSTEAIEDLGVYTNISMIESTEAFRKFAGDKSWAQLDFQTQQQIRLAAILEQTYKRYGDTLADTTQTRHAQFIASLQNIKLLLGQVFLPIYNAVLPALTAMANAIERVVGTLAAFTQALFGKATTIKSTQQQTKATQAQTGAVTDLGNATEKAGKQAKKALAGFDEINKLEFGAGGSSSSGVGGGGTGVIDTGISQIDDGTGGAFEQVSIKAQEMAEKVKTAFTNMKNAIVENKDIIVPAMGAILGAMVGLATYTGITALIKTIKDFGAAIKGAWAFLMAHPIFIVVAAIGALIGALVAAYKTNEEFRESVNKLWGKIKTALTPVVEALGNVLKSLWQNVLVPVGQFIGNAFVKAWEGLGDVASWVWKSVLMPFGDFLKWLWKKVLEPIADIITDVLVIAFKTLGEMAKEVWKNVLKPLADFLGSTLVKAVKGVIEIFEAWWNKALKPIGNFISMTFKPIIEDLINVITFLWKNVFKPLLEFLSGAFITGFRTVTEGIKDIIEGLQRTFSGLIDFLVGTFTGDWKRVWQGVKDIFKGVFDSLWGIVKTPLNLIIDGINGLINGLNKISIKVPDWDWLPNSVQGKSWGINIPRIPKLAEGGITNGPMLAMVGDNPGGREVVSPLDDLLGMIEAVVNNSNSSGPVNLNLTVKIGEDTITEKMISSINRQNRIAGKTVIQV